PVSWHRTNGQAPNSSFLLLNGPRQPPLAGCGAAIDAGLRRSPGRSLSVQRYPGSSTALFMPSLRVRADDPVGCQESLDAPQESPGAGRASFGLSVSLAFR